MALHLPAAARHRRPERAPDGHPYCPDCLETGWRWRWIPQAPIWVGPCHCGRLVDPPPCGWSTGPEPREREILLSSLDVPPGQPSADDPHPISVRHPFRHDHTGQRPLHGYEPYYPVCGCGWVGHPQDSERRGWDLAWAHARIDWRSVPVQPEPRALHRPRRRRDQPPPALPPTYRGPVPCHFGLADQHDGCGKGYVWDQRDGVVSYHGCRGVIPPEPWRTARPHQGTQTHASPAVRGEVCVCPCHLVADEDALPRRCWRCGTLMRLGWPAHRLCPGCTSDLERERSGRRRSTGTPG